MNELRLNQGDGSSPSTLGSYHWDTLFVKGKEMWRHAGSRPDTLRQLKQVHKGDRALLYHGKAEHALYALAKGQPAAAHGQHRNRHEEDGDGLRASSDWLVR